MHKIVNVFVKEPCTGWGPYIYRDMNKSYKSEREIVENFCDNFNFISLRTHKSKIVGGSSVFRLEMVTKYQQEHPECNQAEYQAELVVTEVKQ